VITSGYQNQVRTNQTESTFSCSSSSASTSSSSAPRAACPQIQRSLGQRFPSIASIILWFVVIIMVIFIVIVIFYCFIPLPLCNLGSFPLRGRPLPNTAICTFPKRHIKQRLSGFVISFSRSFSL
jgi:hypothetical protein